MAVLARPVTTRGLPTGCVNMSVQVAMEREVWPEFRPEWRDTYDTLHMISQIIGKVVLALTPKTNHYWNATLLVSPTGLISPLLHTGSNSLTIALDFVDHAIVFRCSDGMTKKIALEPKAVAQYYAEIRQALREMDVPVKIWPMPVEVPNPISFKLDEVHHSYEPEAASAFLKALLLMKPVLEDFRCRFIGKCSPVHFFWGSFDLAVTRFSGNRAPERPGADRVTKEAYSHEVISHGFWLGGGPIAEPAFYAYAAPEPAGFSDAKILPPESIYNADWHEFILPYAAVQLADDPRATLTQFLTTTYDNAANLANWKRADLERQS